MSVLLMVVCERIDGAQGSRKHELQGWERALVLEEPQEWWLAFRSHLP